MPKEIIKNSKTDFIDEFFNEADDPIIDNFGMLGYIESLIDYSLFCNHEKKSMMESINNLKESEANSLIYKLKLNQNLTDPKDQFNRMAKAGVFSSFRDQN
tara:strand:+ start:31280 stop:31582 length:303 start_codon:yes stop_codon:yes gene_type:complete